MHLLLHLAAHLGMHAGLHLTRDGRLGAAILLPWEIWLFVWLAASLLARPNPRPRVAAETTAQRGQYVALGIAAFALVFWARPPWPWGPLAIRLYPHEPGVYLFGAVLAWSGILFTFWARAHLGPLWSGRVAIQQDHHLVQHGPYRWVRHPIYTGMLAAYLGSALALGEVRAICGVAAAVGMFAVKIRHEEALLAPHLGAGYAAYRRRTPALVPGLRSRALGRRGVRPD